MQRFTPCLLAEMLLPLMFHSLPFFSFIFTHQSTSSVSFFYILFLPKAVIPAPVHLPNLAYPFLLVTDCTQRLRTWWLRCICQLLSSLFSTTKCASSYSALIVDFTFLPSGLLALTIEVAARLNVSLLSILYFWSSDRSEHPCGMLSDSTFVFSTRASSLPRH